jgi:hypothetical protein
LSERRVADEPCEHCRRPHCTVHERRHNQTTRRDVRGGDHILCTPLVNKTHVDLLPP